MTDAILLLGRIANRSHLDPQCVTQHDPDPTSVRFVANRARRAYPTMGEIRQAFPKEFSKSRYVIARNDGGQCMREKQTDRPGGTRRKLR